LAAAFLSPCFAQDPRGTILGRVNDSSGAAVPGAEVRAVNESTGVAASAKTNDAGNFTMPYLLSGTYTVSSEHQGFKKWNRPGIQVRINDSVEVDIDLQLGATSETVEVSATTPLLATAEASLGQVVDERRVLELPQFAGNAMDLVHLAPARLTAPICGSARPASTVRLPPSPPTAEATIRTNFRLTAFPIPIPTAPRPAWPSHRRSSPSANSRFRRLLSMRRSATPWAAR
jgi:hypothetical protein